MLCSCDLVRPILKTFAPRRKERTACPRAVIISSTATWCFITSAASRGSKHRSSLAKHGASATTSKSIPFMHGDGHQVFEHPRHLSANADMDSRPPRQLMNLPTKAGMSPETRTVPVPPDAKASRHTVTAVVTYGSTSSLK